MLDALVGELVGSGYAGLTGENVARCAGVHPTTVYRRWVNVEGLIVDQMDRFGTNESPFPDTGSLADDATGLARTNVAFYTDSPHAYTFLETIVAAAARNPRAAETSRVLRRPQRARRRRRRTRHRTQRAELPNPSG